MQTREDVPLSVNFPCVDLIEEGHHDEGVEDGCEMLRWPGVGSIRSAPSTLHIQQVLPRPQEIKNDNELVERLP